MEMKQVRIKIMDVAQQVDGMRERAGRGEQGRKLSILFTELEKVYAFARHIDALDETEAESGGSKEG
jgi:hypothetical protein